MKTKLIFLLFMSLVVGYSQSTEKIIKPIIDSTLVVELQNCKYIDRDIYIINSDYVIYENCDTRKYLYPDMKSFYIPFQNTDNFFALDKNGVYFRGEFIPTDTTGFEVIGKNNDYYNIQVLWKAKSQIYQNTTPIKVSDIETFKTIECFNGFYYKDKNFLYYFDGKLKKIENSDVASVEPSCDEFCYDKNNVYWKGEIVTFENEKVIPINDFLFKTSKHVLKRLNTINLQFQIIPEIDLKTIKRLSKSYAMDNQSIYYRTNKLSILPSDNIKALGNYLSDEKNIYSITETKTNLDSQSFGIIQNTEFIYDKNGIYEQYWSDGKHIYRKIPFEYTESVSIKDIFNTNYSYLIYKNQIYDIINDKVENLTDENISLIKKGKNKYNIEMNGIKEFEYGLTKKNNKIYWKNRETIADAKSFQQLNYYYKDKNRVYYYDYEKGLITIEGIDAQSAELFNGFVKDKNYLYDGKVPLLKSKDIELLGIFAGYRRGCGLDKQSPSDYYLFRNTEGYWLVHTSDDVIMRNLGKELPDNWNKNIKEFVVK